MERKILEKLREGYPEVAADAGFASAGKKGAAAAKLTLPPRFAAPFTAPPHALLRAATMACNALARETSDRSWRSAQAAKEAGRALHRIAGVSLDVSPELGAAFDACCDAVLGKPALPLGLVLALLDELPPSAFARALRRWSEPRAPRSAPCGR